MLLVLVLDPEVQSCRGSLKPDRVICAAYRRLFENDSMLPSSDGMLKGYSERLVCQPHEKYAT